MWCLLNLVIPHLHKSECYFDFDTLAICLVWQNLHLVSSHSSLCPTWQEAVDWQPGHQAHPSAVSPEAGRRQVWISHEASSHFLLPNFHFQPCQYCQDNILIDACLCSPLHMTVTRQSEHTLPRKCLLSPFAESASIWWIFALLFFHIPCMHL